jgi:hypothetical protein
MIEGEKPRGRTFCACSANTRQFGNYSFPIAPDAVTQRRNARHSDAKAFPEIAFPVIIYRLFSKDLGNLVLQT